MTSKEGGMNEPTLEMVLQRFDLLERQVRRWRRIGLAAVVLSGLVVLLGATKGKQVEVAEDVRAKRFTLVDEEGKARAVLGKVAMCTWRMEKGEAIALALFDHETRLRATLGLTADGRSGLYLCDKDEMRRVSLEVSNIPAL
jgi:hypothetical protein